MRYSVYGRVFQSRRTDLLKTIEIRSIYMERIVGIRQTGDVASTTVHASDAGFTYAINTDASNQ